MRRSRGVWGCSERTSERHWNDCPSSGEGSTGERHWTCARAGVLAAPPLVGLLDRLVTKSVVLVGHRESGVRFTMLESVRRASLASLELDERRRLQEAHRGYFAGRAIELGPRMYVGTAEAVDAIDADLDNLRAALLLALHGDGDLGVQSMPDLGSAMVQVLMPYWTKSGTLGRGSGMGR